MFGANRSREGRPFTLDEYQKISEWNSRDIVNWPHLELALNYPNTPEMLGVVEHSQRGPTLFVWAADWGIVIEPFNGGSFIYPDFEEALNALSRWARLIIAGQRVHFGSGTGERRDT